MDIRGQNLVLKLLGSVLFQHQIGMGGQFFVLKLSPSSDGIVSTPFPIRGRNVGGRGNGLAIAHFLVAKYYYQTGGKELRYTPYLRG